MTGSRVALVRAVRGPIMLIVLGCLFALDYFSQYRFTRTFPILLIVFGVMKLIERVAAEPRPEPPAGPEL